MYNFILGPVDTDSISFCYPDFRPISKEEQIKLLYEINSILPEKIVMDDDGYFETIVAIRAKNYVLYDGKKIKIKGSALKASTKEPALKEFISKSIDIIIHTPDIEDIKLKMVDLYEAYVREIMKTDDIKRWASRKTISKKTMTSTRANETKVMDALTGSEWSEGDRIHTYFDKDDNLKLVQNWTSDHSRVKLLSKLHATAEVFATVLPTNEMFPKYHNKTKQKLLIERGYSFEG